MNGNPKPQDRHHIERLVSTLLEHRRSELNGWFRRERSTASYYSTDNFAKCTYILIFFRFVCFCFSRVLLSFAPSEPTAASTMELEMTSIIKIYTERNSRTTIIPPTPYLLAALVDTLKSVTVERLRSPITPSAAEKSWFLVFSHDRR